MSLNRNERKALSALLDRGRSSSFMPRTLDQLVRKGLARTTTGVVGWSPRYTITDAGRQALSDDRPITKDQ